MRILKHVTSVLVIACLMMGTASTCFAMDTAGTASVPVVLTVEASTFSVTVPTSLPVSVSKSGVVTVSDNVEIVNNSHGAVEVTDVSLSVAENSNWKIVSFETNMLTEHVGTKKLGFQLTAGNNDSISSVADGFEDTEILWHIPAKSGTSDNNKLKINYSAKLPAQNTAITSATVANVVFTIGWSTGTN